MAITFPNSPSSGDTHTSSNGLQYTYDGEKWTTIGTNSAGTWTRTGTTVALTTATDDLSANTATFSGAVNFDDDVIVKGDGTNGSGELTLNCENNSHGVKIKGPPHSAGANYTLVLPNDTGTSGQVLTTNGSGVSSWSTIDLSSKLSLTGGTLTGGLTGTTANFSGNVGIGTSTISRKFVVSGGSSEAVAQFTNATSGVGADDGFQIIHFNNGYTQLLNRENEALSFGTNNTERMRIDSSGRLLIGATSAIDGGSSTLLQVASTGGARFALARNDTTTAANDSIGRIRWYGNDSDGNYDECARIEVIADADHASNSKPSALIFRTTAASAEDTTERMRIDSDGVAHFNGDVKVLNGDIQMGSGRGINFSANSHATGMTSETLDDYEEGTWTPNIGSNATYTTQEGRYTKIGRLVSVSAVLIINAKGNGSNNVISGFPFTGRATTSGNPAASGVITTASNLATAVTSLTLYLGSGTTSAIFAGFTGASTSNSNAPNIFQNSTRIDFSMTYEAS